MKPLPHLLAGETLHRRLEWQFYKGVAFGGFISLIGWGIATLWIGVACR